MICVLRLDNHKHKRCLAVFASSEMKRQFIMAQLGS